LAEIVGDSAYGLHLVLIQSGIARRSSSLPPILMLSVNMIAH